METVEWTWGNFTLYNLRTGKRIDCVTLEVADQTMIGCGPDWVLAQTDGPGDKNIFDGMKRLLDTRRNRTYIQRTK